MCDICNNNHKAADCPLKGKCRRFHEAGHFVRNCPKPLWYVPGNPATDVDSDNDNVDDNDVNDDGVVDVNGVEVAAVTAPVVPGAVQPVVASEVVPAGNPAEPEPGTSAGAEVMCVDVRDNELDELVSQPLLVSGSGGAEESVLDPPPSQVSVSVLEASAGLSGAPQEEVLKSSPSFTPLSGADLSVTPSLAVSEDVVGSGDDVSGLISGF